mmetsp:Transcript_4526/g.8400  ORF Transcript_4526/g.8400 Transcript_4526/m.8400 type:complete len:95 (+) Transcript_4526:1362-1646(+)
MPASILAWPTLNYPSCGFRRNLRGQCSPPQCSQTMHKFFNPNNKMLVSIPNNAISGHFTAVASLFAVLFCQPVHVTVAIHLCPPPPANQLFCCC